MGLTNLATGGTGGIRTAGLQNLSTEIDFPCADDVYVCDDWDDGKITNRDNADTATTGGQEAVYRPEWNEFTSGISVVDKYDAADDLQIQVTNISGVDYGYTLPDESLQWDFEFRKDNDDGDSGLAIILTADGSQNYIGLHHQENKDNWVLQTNSSEILKFGDSAIPYSQKNNITVTRDKGPATPEWEVITNGTSQGTAQTSDWYSGYIGFENDNSGKYLDEGANAPDSDSWWDELTISQL